MKVMKVMISLEIEKSLKDKLGKLAKREGRLKSYLLEEALKDLFIKKSVN